MNSASRRDSVVVPMMRRSSSVLPSGVIESATTRPECPCSVSRCDQIPVRRSTSQMTTTPESSAEAAQDPSGDSTTSYTTSWWACSTCVGRPVPGTVFTMLLFFVSI